MADPIAELDALLSEWGSFDPVHRAAIAARHAGGAEQAPAAFAALVARWAAALRPGSPPPAAALRAAFLAIDGARRWPEQFLNTSPDPAFAAEIAAALPRPLPEPAPLSMPEQEF